MPLGPNLVFGYIRLLTALNVLYIYLVIVLNMSALFRLIASH